MLRLGNKLNSKLSLLGTTKEVFPRVLPAASRKNYSSGVDDDFLHKSIVPTDHFQKSLPRLGIPKLETTCERYLRSQSVLLDPEQYKQTEKLTHDFRDGIGTKLQDELTRIDQLRKHTSYISGPWFDMYLKDRRPVVINHNPFIAFNDDTRADYNSQLVRTTNMIVSSMRFMKTLRANILEPEVYHLNPKKSDTDTYRKVVRMLPKSISAYGSYLFKAFPLDMSQYGRLFNGARIPRLEKDELYCDETAKNLVVLRNGHLYSFDILDSNGNIKPAPEIMANLQDILNDTRPPAEHPLAVFTTLNRDVGAKFRDKLLAAGNEQLIQKIDGGLFMLSLDDTTTEDPKELSMSFLHGDGSNRWFDKSFNLITTATGKACVNFEHAWGDGVAVLRYFNEVYKDTTQKPQVHPDTKPASGSSSVERLDPVLNDEMKRDINNALADFHKTSATLDLSFLKFEKFGKKYLKTKKLSPDSFMQLAFQMGYYRQYGKTVATYESCSTAAFKHGRTETIRPATPATKKACEMFDRTKGNASVEEMQAALAECSKVHGGLTVDAAKGQGWDRHLFGLKTLALGTGWEFPEIFQDPAYAAINHNILSTSTLSSPAVLIGGFAPVVPDGYGVGYGTEDDMLGLNVTSYHANTDVNGFLECVNESFNDMYEVLEGRNIRK